MDSFEALVSRYQDILKEIGSVTVGNAANAISKMVDETVMINVPKIMVVSLKGVSKTLRQQDESMVCIYGRLLGNSEGLTMVLMSQKNANILANILMHRPVDMEGPFSEMDLSALKEVGNIIVGSFANTLYQFIDILLQPSVPGLVIDSIDSTVNFIEEEYGLGNEDLFCIKSEFVDAGHDAEGEFYILFERRFVDLVIDKVNSLFIISRKLAIYDGLTKLYSREYLLDCLEKEYQRARRYQRPLSLIMVDIDDLKKINDHYGHPEGDTILRQLGEVLIDCIRKADIPARYGGDEFVIVLPETGLEKAIAIAERLRLSIATYPFTVNGKKIEVTASCGVASHLQSDVDSKDDLVFLADMALYHSKEKGRNRVSVSTSSSKAVALEDFKLKERRIFKRIGVEGPMQYMVPFMDKSPVEIKEAITKNISAGGVMFETREILKPESYVFLSLNIKLSESQNYGFQVFSQIMWTKRKGRGKTEAGAKFIHLSPEDRKKIAALTKKFSDEVAH